MLPASGIQESGAQWPVVHPTVGRVALNVVKEPERSTPIAVGALLEMHST